MRHVLNLFVLSGLVTVLGCGGIPSDFGRVSGKVTLDDEPLADAFVTFQPDSGDRKSEGKTDANGNYELQYTFKQEGARVGTHKVSISTYQERTYNDDGTYGPPAPEKVPVQYNKETTLTATVEGTSNSIDFDLKSEGEIFTPALSDPEELGEESDQ